MTFLQILLWSGLAILLYCYVGYGVMLFIFNKIKTIGSFSKMQDQVEYLPVTLVIAAYNERAVLSSKIENSLEIDYPVELLNIIFITDGSTDNPEEVIGKYSQITLLHQSKREGKSAALKRAMRFVQTPIVVFSDANSILNRNCLKAMIRHFADKKVGGVAGEKKIIQDKYFSAVGQAEGMYWRYESFMKKQDSDFNTVVGAAGELFSMRTELFHAPDDHIILDDFLFSIRVCLEGYKIKYEPGAFALETPSASLAEEEKRKIRIAAGAYQSVSFLTQCLNIFKFPLLSIQYFSRRLLRWILSPILIFLVLITNIELVLHHQGTVFIYLLFAQGIFYVLAITGRLMMAVGWRMGILGIPFYFIFMNLCLVKGFFKFIQGRQSVLWEKSIREAIE